VPGEANCSGSNAPGEAPKLADRIFEAASPAAAFVSHDLACCRSVVGRLHGAVAVLCRPVRRSAGGRYLCAVRAGSCTRCSRPAADPGGGEDDAVPAKGVLVSCLERLSSNDGALVGTAWG